MSTTHPEIAHLDPAQKRALLERLLREKDRKSKAFPISFAQQRLWFLDKLQPGSAVYNVPSVVKLKGFIRVEEFQKALDAVVARHEALRTTFEGADEAPEQKVNPPRTGVLRLVDLSGKSEELQRHETEKIVRTEVRLPFDLSRDLMIRATLVRLAPKDHVLIVVTHHIASDEWSLRILFREWAENYAQLCGGKEVAQPALEIQYSDFAQWQREWVTSNAYCEQLRYWSNRLKAPPVLQLPTDHPHPAAQTFNGTLREKLLPKALLEKLKEFSRQENCTLFMTVLAAFKVMLHRYTRMEDIIVGCPIAGRNRMETEPLIGFFVNTLALRTSLAGKLSFRQLLQAVRETTLGAYASQDIPFDRLVEELHPERSATHMPFVQVMFSLHNEIVPGEIFPGLRSEWIEADTGTAKCDLTLFAKDTAQGLRVVLEYNTDLFDSPRMERLFGHFQHLLESAMAHPDETIARLEMLTPKERAQVLVEWNQTRREYPREASVHELFEIQAAKTPGAIALQYQDRTICYGELNTRANQLANFLVGSTDGHGLVGVYMERSIEMVTAFLAILKAGCAYVPLDLSYPKERLEFMVADTGMPLVLTQAERRGELPTGVNAVCLDTEWEMVARQSSQTPPVKVNGDSLAYIIYTSGSTGQPKGVAVPHRGITRLVLNTDYVQLKAGDRIAQASNASFDAATFEIWGALLNGACAIGVSKELALSPADFAEFAKRERITTLFLTTALFNQMARETPNVFGTMNSVMFGGEAVDPKWVQAVLACAPPKDLLHVYGPTENTTFSTWFKITNVSEESGTVPIGRPIANSTLYVLGPELMPVPIGVPGEIYVGGDGLAKGYWKRPELTAEKFVASPFSADKGARLYRTGDVGRFDEHGNVEFIGRVDHQIKLRGFRIELGEIESLLARHPRVANAVVMLREDLPGDARLVGYVIPKGEVPTPLELRLHLKAHLPDYMIPAAFVQLDEFPLTPNEKVDRKALPAPEQNRPELNKKFVAPRDALEQQLTKIWEKILGVQPIGIADNFFDLGGHSLLAVRVFSQIEKTLKMKLPLATLFRAPTIEEIATILREDNQAKSWSTIVDIQPKGSKRPFYWIHTLGGDGGGGFFYYRKLAELLGPDQPSFGIRSPEEPFTRIEDMARFYLKEIRKFQPEGPYFLGGFCFGGNVAYEMAQQLRAAGEAVGLLVMLESTPPNVNLKHSWSATAAKYSIENIVENMKDFVHVSSEEKLAMLKSKGRRLTEKIRKKITPASESKSAELSQIIDLATYPEGYVKYAETHWHALTVYHPLPYGGEITLFRAKKQGLTNFNHTLGWDALVGDRVRVTVMPGTHESMLQEPNVQIVAEKLRELLANAEAAALKA